MWKETPPTSPSTLRRKLGKRDSQAIIEGVEAWVWWEIMGIQRHGAWGQE